MANTLSTFIKVDLPEPFSPHMDKASPHKLNTHSHSMHENTGENLFYNPNACHKGCFMFCTSFSKSTFFWHLFFKREKTNGRRRNGALLSAIDIVGRLRVNKQRHESVNRQAITVESRLLLDTEIA